MFPLTGSSEDYEEQDEEFADSERKVRNVRFGSWEKQLRERKSSGEAAVEIGGDAHRVRLRGRRPAELEKGHQSKASGKEENGAVTNRQSEDPGGKRMCTEERETALE